MTSQYGHGFLSIFFGGKYDLIPLHRQIIHQKAQNFFFNNKNKITTSTFGEWKWHDFSWLGWYCFWPTSMATLSLSPLVCCLEQKSNVRCTSQKASCPNVNTVGESHRMISRRPFERFVSVCTMLAPPSSIKSTTHYRQDSERWTFDTKISNSLSLKVTLVWS